MGKASDKRLARVTSLVKRTLSEIVSEELKDPRLGIFSITDIRLSRDLSFADVMVSAVGGAEATEQCVEVLNSAGHLLRNRLRDATDLRIVPQLKFTVDRGSEYEQEIHKLISELPPAAEESEESEG